MFTDIIEWALQIMLFAVLATAMYFLSGCATPDKWRPVDHQETMGQCRIMCDKSVKSYEPLTGECACHIRHSRSE